MVFARCPARSLPATFQMIAKISIYCDIHQGKRGGEGRGFPEKFASISVKDFRVPSIVDATKRAGIGGLFQLVKTIPPAQFWDLPGARRRRREGCKGINLYARASCPVCFLPGGLPAKWQETAHVCKIPLTQQEIQKCVGELLTPQPLRCASWVVVFHIIFSWVRTTLPS